jgi:hypothetical protein
MFRRGFALCQARPPPRVPRIVSRLRLRIGALWRGRPADALHTCWLAVANWDLRGHCLSFAGSKLPADSHSAGSRFLIAACRLVPKFAFSGCVRPQAVGTGELCPGPPADKPAKRQGARRANCARPFSGCPDSSRGYSHTGLATRAFHPRSLKELSGLCGKPCCIARKNLRKALKISHL